MDDRALSSLSGARELLKFSTVQVLVLLPVLRNTVKHLPGCITGTLLLSIYHFQILVLVGLNYLQVQETFCQGHKYCTVTTKFSAYSYYFEVIIW